MPEQDPYAPYLQQAEALYASGDITKAGQIWQAILKRVPSHTIAREGLRKVRLHFDVRATQEPAPRPAEGAASTHADMPLASQQPIKPRTPEVAALLEQGCTHYDAGRIEEAHRAWELALEKEPDNALVRGYLNMARAQMGLEALAAPGTTPEPPSTPSPVAEPEPSPAAVPEVEAAPAAPEPSQEELLDQRLRKGCTLFDLGQTEDALTVWMAILEEAPTHRQAHAYAQEALRQTGRTLLPDLPPPTQTRVHNSASGEDLDRLVDQASQLWELGMTDEAMNQWQRILDQDPGHPRAAELLAMARKAMEPPPSRPAAAPAPTSAPVPMAPMRQVADVKNLMRSAQALLQAGRLNEAARTFGEILEDHPDHPEALHGYQQVRALIQAQLSMVIPETAGSPVIEPEDPTLLEPAAPPPAAIVQEAPQARRGLEAPQALKRFQLPPALQDVRIQVILLASCLVLSIGGYSLLRWQREATLKARQKEAVKQVELEALASTRPVELSFPPDAIHKEIDSLLPLDPLAAFQLAKGRLRMAPDDTKAPGLMEDARKALAALPAPAPATAEDVARLLASGDLAGAMKTARERLLLEPDNAEAREGLAHVALVQARFCFEKDDLDGAREALRLGRALCPDQSIWWARLQVLATVSGMSKTERAPWLHLLG